MGRSWGTRKTLALSVVGVVVLVVLAAVGAGTLYGARDAEPDQWFASAGKAAGLNYTEVRQNDDIRGDMSNAGVYVADVNNDRRPDVLAVGGTHPVLFENTGGAFERSDALPPIRVDTYVRAALFFDYDDDGWQDLLLLVHGGKPVFLENDGGTFVRRDVGFDEPLSVPIGASAADYDGDGCLDLFVIQNGNWDDAKPARMTGDTAAMAEGNGNPNYLYRGTCGSFERVEDAGISGEHWSLATSFVDLTGDGRPDIHVANDFNYDTLYVNQGDGTFERKRIEGTNRNAMSSEVADVNHDGRLDIFVTNIYWTDNAQEAVGAVDYAVRDHQGNNLLINQGNGTFVDRAPEYGVLKGRWGWAAVAGDLDNDGDLDLFHTTRGKFFRKPPYFVNLTKLYTFKQARFFERTGERNFTPRRATDLGFTHLDGRGVARLDYDNDGTLDLVVANATGRFMLFENQRNPGQALELSVVNDRGSPAIGARAFVTVNGTTRLRAVHSRSDYLSQEWRTLHVGTGENETVDRVRVVWPDGTERTLTDVPAGQRVVVGPDGVVARCPFGSDCTTE